MTETLSLCPHGCPVKFNNCILCNQVDENRKISKRVDELEKALENYREYKTAIENLETDEIYIKEQLTRLENLITEAGRKPHVCPLCNGDGGTLLNSVIDTFCNACKGTSVVWG